MYLFITTKLFEILQTKVLNFLKQQIFKIF